MEKREINFINLGPIRDLPIQKGYTAHAFGRKFDVFRETFGHCYVLDHNSLEAVGEDIHQSRLEGQKLRFDDGKALDLHSGAIDGEDSKKVKIFNAWVENGFILVSLTEVLSSIGMM